MLFQHLRWPMVSESLLWNDEGGVGKLLGFDKIRRWTRHDKAIPNHSIVPPCWFWEFYGPVWTIGSAPKLALVWKRPSRLPANRLPWSTTQDLGLYHHVVVAIKGAGETAQYGTMWKVNTTLLCLGFVVCVFTIKDFIDIGSIWFDEILNVQKLKISKQKPIDNTPK